MRGKCIYTQINKCDIYISLTHTFYIHTFYTYIKKNKIAVKGKCHLPETTNTLTD